MRTKKNPEMPMVPKAHLKNVEHQRDEYKAELHRWKVENEKLKEEIEHLNSVIQNEEDWKLLELEERFRGDG